jgi:gluconokinase
MIIMSVKIILVMGVSGSGKTVVGRALAQSLGWDFYDADDFHPPANIAKMSAGIPLTDDDRAPWLNLLHEKLLESRGESRNCVMACSALKAKYRKVLFDGVSNFQVVYLKGGYDLISQRMQTRTGHYMKPEMLKSQFDALEEPINAFVVNIAGDVNEIVYKVIEFINITRSQ